MRRRCGRPTHAGKSSRIDFLLKHRSIGLETKMTRDGLEDGSVGDELTVDIARYSKHADVGILYCLIYDPEQRLQNPVGLERDLSGRFDGLEARTIVCPK
jgi:hypothetical protein